MFWSVKNVYALYAVLGPRLDTVGVWGSNPHAPTNFFNELALTGHAVLCSKRFIRNKRPLAISRDRLYSFASRGDYIDLAAPGVEIVSTVPGNKFNTFSGTSMAAPHVSAFVALLLQTNPLLSPSEIKSILERTARDLGAVGRDKDSGSGVLDACLAFQRGTSKKVCG
jgi:subtilisin family serine protease